MISIDDMDLASVSEDDTTTKEVDINEAEAIDAQEEESGEERFNVARVGDNQVIGMESFAERLSSYDEKTEARMGAVMITAGPKMPPFSIRMSGEHDYRIYFSSEMLFKPDVITALCRFLDTRTPQDTVTFILGSELCDFQCHSVGAIVSAMTSCPANVVAVAAGWCSVTSTIIWCFAKQRDIWKYGALTFSVSDILKVAPELKVYFELFLNKAKDLGLLDDGELEKIWKSNETIMKMYEDLTGDRAKVDASVDTEERVSEQTEDDSKEQEHDDA